VVRTVEPVRHGVPVSRETLTTDDPPRADLSIVAGTPVEEADHRDERDVSGCAARERRCRQQTAAPVSRETAAERSKAGSADALVAPDERSALGAQPGASTPPCDERMYRPGRSCTPVSRRTRTFKESPSDDVPAIALPIADQRDRQQPTEAVSTEAGRDGARLARPFHVKHAGRGESEAVTTGVPTPHPVIGYPLRPTPAPSTPRDTRRCTQEKENTRFT